MSGDSCRKPKSLGKPKKEPDFHSEEDLSFLEEFCDAIDIEEISYERWSSRHQDLDLSVPCFLTADEARFAGSRELSFSRTIRMTKGEQEEIRIQSSILVSWNANVKDGQTFQFPGKGDQKDGDTGDLKVRIRLKNQ